MQELSDTGVPVGTTGLIQRQNLSDTGLIGYRSTRRYYRTYSDARVPVGTTRLIQIQDLSDTGVPVGTTELIQMQEYP